MNEKTSQMQATSPGASVARDGDDRMRKIIFMVGVAIFAFLAFTAFSVHKSIQNSQQLADIRDLYFPVLERVDANIVRLDKMEERYTQAVMTAERDQIEEADDIYIEADKDFVEMNKLYSARAGDIARLRADLKQYKELASSTSLAMLERKDNSNSGAMNKALASLKESLKGFRQSSYSNFVVTLQESQQSSQINLYVGIFIGIMNLSFMGILVFFIRNNMRMTSVIAEQNATLELRVAERTAQLRQKTQDINAMLNNMNLGVCTVVPGNRLHPEYSAYMRTIFGTDDFAGRDVIETLFAESTLGVDSRDQINAALETILGEDSMMFDFNSHLLVNEMHIRGSDGKNKILKMDWSPIKNDDDIVDKVLLTAEDITHLRELERESSNQKEELAIISQIIRVSIGNFNDFISSARKLAEENRRLIQETQGLDPEVIPILFRNMHTIKGNARTYEFKNITNAAHLAEEEYDQLRKDVHAKWNSARMLRELDAVDAAITSYVEISEDVLGRKGRASDLLTSRGVFVSIEEISSLKSIAAELVKNDSCDAVIQLQKTTNSLGLIPLERLVSGSMDSISSLAKELHKPTPKVEIINGDIGFNHAIAQPLKSSLMHIVRNSLDHGIEYPEERVLAGKPERGLLRVSCERFGDRVELHISDDGRGIALHKLYEKGLTRGAFNADKPPTPEALAELVFQSGLSTATEITQISGRGVGMSAVRDFLKEQGATVRIVLKNSGAEFNFTPFELVITLPPSTYFP